MQHLLPSDGSGIDPHATRLVVRPVTQTGQRRAENGRRWVVGGGGGGGGVQVQSHTQKVPRRQTLCTACPVTSYRARSVLAASLVRSGDSRCTASASRRIAASYVGRDAVETLRRTASSLGITGNTGSPRLSHHPPPPLLLFPPADFIRGTPPTLRVTTDTSRPVWTCAAFKCCERKKGEL